MNEFDTFSFKGNGRGLVTLNSSLLGSGWDSIFFWIGGNVFNWFCSAFEAYNKTKRVIKRNYWMKRKKNNEKK